MYLLFFLVLCPIIHAQTFPGSRQSALCYSDIAFGNDVFSVYNNPASSALFKSRETGVYYSPSPFGLKELATSSFAHNEYFDFVSITGGYINYGYELYKENNFLISFSTEAAEGLYLGAAGNYQLIQIRDYGSTDVFYLNLGSIIYLNPAFSLGFSIYNITHASFDSETDQVPMIFKSGISYNNSGLFSLHLAIIKDIRYNFSCRGGFEYKIFNVLSLRSGFSTEPVQYSAGAGIYYRIFSFDYTLSSHPYLGISHQLGTIISFREMTN